MLCLVIVIWTRSRLIFEIDSEFDIFQANSSVSDAEKEDRKAMEKKLDEMEEKLKVFLYFKLHYMLIF